LRLILVKLLLIAKRLAVSVTDTRTRTRFGERGFFYSGPAAWNTLPSDLHDITDTRTFRKRLKNVLFDHALTDSAGAPGRVV